MLRAATKGHYRARGNSPGRDFEFRIEWSRSARVLAIMPAAVPGPFVSLRVDRSGWDSSGCVLEILP